MMSVTQAVAFGGVVLVAAMSPGPDFVVLMRNLVGLGVRIAAQQ
jgi:threonine/homoserine/homoserine lactone efflux protein